MVDLQEAVRLVEEEALAVPIRRDLLTVTGGDAASYLQGQVSQDVERLAVGATAWTLLLQPQGKVDGWLRVHRRAADEFWLDTDEGHGSAAEARLNRFKLRVDATIETTTVTGLAVRGPGAARAGEAASAVLATAPRTGLVALDAGWGGIDGFDVLGPGGVPDPAELATALDLPLGSPEAAEVLRLLQARPAMGHELDESTIPAAAGVVEASVDFTKGCYVGQELVARIDSRGNNTPTRLHTLRLAGGEAPADGSELVLDGEVVGTVTSAIAIPGRGVVGLGYLKRSVESPATLSVRSEGTEEGAEDRPVEVAPLPAG